MTGLVWLLLALVCVAALAMAVHVHAVNDRKYLADFLRALGGELCPLCDSYQMHEVTSFDDTRHKWVCCACGTKFDGELIERAS